jgi:putative nucleotidyltransferase with HDIG domain
MMPSGHGQAKPHGTRHFFTERKKQILLVDDEVEILQGLRRRLRFQNPDWSMTLETDPKEALSRLRQQRFDVLVTDMRMPGMDGPELLAHAREIHPDMPRIVLSGQTTREASVLTASLAHRCLAKPCDVSVIGKAVSQCCRLRDLLPDTEFAKITGRLSALPSLPTYFSVLREEANRRDASLGRIARIVEQDPALTAKVLQLVYSAFFGLGGGASSIEEAVGYLGIDVIRALVSSNSAFEVLGPDDTGAAEALSRHSLLTGRLAARIAETTTSDPKLAAIALQAGLLHDIGKLVLDEKHEEVGAFLMGLWGLPDEIVDAIAFHHAPRESGQQEFSPLTAVHIADALLDEHDRPTRQRLDTGYLSALGLDGSIDSWRGEADRIIAEYCAR